MTSLTDRNDCLLVSSAEQKFRWSNRFSKTVNLMDGGSFRFFLLRSSWLRNCTQVWKDEEEKSALNPRYHLGCWWLESASFTENLDESSASVKKRCKKYLNQVATMSCNVSQRVSRKAVWKITRVEVVHFEFLLRLWNWTIIGYYSWYYNYVIVFLV